MKCIRFMQKEFYPTFSWTREVCVNPLRVRALVQNDKRMQEHMKIMATYAVKTFNTFGVETPNKESPTSPPKDAPSPIDLASWIKITNERIQHRIKKRTILTKYKTPIRFNLCPFRKNVFILPYCCKER